MLKSTSGSLQEGLQAQIDHQDIFAESAYKGQTRNYDKAKPA